MAYHKTSSPGRRVSHLPCRYVDIPGMQLQLDYLLLDDVTESFKLVQDAATRGANVGVDEYPDEESFRERLELSEAFVLKDQTDGKLKALIMVHPFLMSRTLPIYLARLFVFCSAELDSCGAFPCLLDLSQRLTHDIGLSYTSWVMLVFRKCEATVRELRRQRFHVVAYLPLGGALVDTGPCETLVLYKEMSGADPVEWSLEDRTALARTIVDPGAVDAGRFPDIPSLPVTHRLRDGTLARMRVMRPDECGVVYALFRQAARAGSGYSVDETLTLDAFTEWFLLDHYNIIWETADTGRMIGFSSIGDEPVKRSNKAAACDSSVVVRPEYYKRGIGGELVEVMESFAVQLGYTAISSDTPIVNHRMCDLIGHRGYSIVGVLPNCINIAGHGIVDLLISYKSLKGVGPFVPRDGAGAPTVSKL